MAKFINTEGGLSLRADSVLKFTDISGGRAERREASDKDGVRRDRGTGIACDVSDLFSYFHNGCVYSTCIMQNLARRCTLSN